MSASQVATATRSPAGTTPPIVGKSRGGLRAVATLLAVPIALVVAWALLASSLDSIVFPSPWESVRGLADDLGRQDFRESVYASLRLLAVSWVFAAVVGGLLGFALGQSPFWTRVFSTPLFAFYSIPKVTLYPVFLLLLGLGETSRIAFAFFHGVFPMALLVMGAAAGLDRRLVRLADALELTWIQRLRMIVLPALLPTVLVALRISFGLTFLGLVLAEMFSSDIGLGHELVSNVAQVRVDRIAGQVLLIAGLALLPVLAMLAAERRIRARTGQ